jgi:dolichyl-phosphate-mannose-protein mannosyltransferase
MHFAAANQTSWLATYKASLTISHPPLLIFLLHIWRVLGTSELVLRLPSIIAGIAFCWLAFRWAQMLFGDAVAWTVFAFTLFLPTCIELSTEVRQYALFLAFAMGSAYLLERALADSSGKTMLLSGLCGWLAICSHFSAFLFVLVLGIYALWRMSADHPRVGVFAAWLATQLFAAVWCAFFYFFQIRHLTDYYAGQDATHGWMANAYLGHGYFVPGKVNPLLFIVARTVSVFQYAFRQLIVGDIAFLFFVAGLILVFRSRPIFKRVTFRQLGCFLLLPFAINCAAALDNAYPYGGTRHSAFLLPFALAGVAVALSRAVKQRISSAVAIAILIALICRLTTAQKPPYFASDNERSANMQAAMEFIQNLPKNETVFGDFQTNLMLGHYLCNQRPVTPDKSVAGFVSYECGGRRVIASTMSNAANYVFDARSFRAQWQLMMAKYHFDSGSKICIAQLGQNTHLASELAASEAHIAPRYFGSEIQFFELTAQ